MTVDQVRADTVDRSRGRDPGYRPDMTTTPQNPNEEPNDAPTEDPSPSSDPEPNNDDLSGPGESK